MIQGINLIVNQKKKKKKNDNLMNEIFLNLSSFDFNHSYSIIQLQARMEEIDS